MREQVVITPVSIKKSGEIKYFQIRLPKNSKQIIGIEIGSRGISEKLKATGVLPPWLTFNRNTFIGEMKLQSCEQANIFYATDIQLDENLGFGDFSQNITWQANNFSHQRKTEEETVKVNGDTAIVQGVYKDRIGEQNNIDMQYTVNVYVWVEIEEICSTENKSAEK